MTSKLWHFIGENLLATDTEESGFGFDVRSNIPDVGERYTYDMALIKTVIV